MGNLFRIFSNFINKIQKNTIIEQNRKEAVQASGELTQAMVDHLNVG